MRAAIVRSCGASKVEDSLLRAFSLRINLESSPDVHRRPRQVKVGGQEGGRVGLAQLDLSSK